MLIEINDFAVTLQRKRVKNINLRIDRSGAVQISAPLRMSMDVIQRFLQEKTTWIEMHRQRLQQLEQTSTKNINPGEYIYFQGIKYAVHLFESPSFQTVQLHENQIHFYVKPTANAAQKERMLAKWYRSQMEKILPPLLDKWQTIMGVVANQVSIKCMKSRWGSCHPTKKDITFNLRLIEKPLTCIEYVVVHELVHLFEASHNKRFYALMSHYLPEWKQIRKQLG